tara:strand:- start:5624 stop:6358 length:735 start_codon:yes stop_codon:yes gene_type:complete
VINPSQIVLNVQKSAKNMVNSASYFSNCDEIILIGTIRNTSYYLTKEPDFCILAIKLKQMRYLAIFIVAFTFYSCSSVSVVTDYDKTVDFGKYKTFNIKTHEVGVGAVDPERINKRNLNHIVTNIREQMTQKGYIESANPDLWISFYVKVDTKQEVRTTNYGYYGGSPYYYGPYYGYGTGYTDINVVEFTEGTLIIDLVDSKENKLVWQGVGKKTIDENKIDHGDDIRKTIGQIFYKYRFSPVN